MSRSPIWREFESSESSFARVVRVLVFWIVGIFLFMEAAIPLAWPQQALVAALMVLAAVWVHRISSSSLITLTLILISCFATLRYAWWRVVSTALFFSHHAPRERRLDEFFITVVLAAEAYAFAVLFLGYFQALWPLRRAPVPLPENPVLWPEVDLLITTYREPLHVVKSTVLAALNIDWPEEKLNIYLLDDGRRDEFREFAEQAGIGYMARPDNEYAKAGNINGALVRLRAPFVALFDADQVPTRSFLQLTMGWFGRDARLGLLQTPQHFYSPDPFERNLNQFRHVPSENDLFHGVGQDGNDLWNATSFSGSCAVLRREALDDIGGLAVETVTQDAHTSIRLQGKGWGTAYINIPQASGLATERLSAYIRQRVHRARGMTQILRVDNPLFRRGLKLAQRLCYFNAAAHFFFALPRLVFLTAPLIYLILGRTNLPGSGAAILAYAIPHLCLLHLTQSRIQGQHRHSFWNEIYETVLAPYMVLPIFGALLRPQRRESGVTAKGQVVEASFFDTRVARPFILLLGMNVVGLLCALPRAHLFRASDEAGWWGWLLSVPHAMYSGAHLDFVALNVVWTVFNMVLLGVAIAVASETRQRRRAVRVDLAVPVGMILADGRVIQGFTGDVSSTGVRLRTNSGLSARSGDPVRIIFPVLDADASVPATVVAVEDDLVRACFDKLSLNEEEMLTLLIYSRADSWLGWGEMHERDHPLRSFLRLLALASRGLRQALFPPARRERTDGLLTDSLRVLPLMLLFSGLFTLLPLVHAQISHSVPGAFSKNRHVTQMGSSPDTIGTTPAQQSSSAMDAEADLGKPQLTRTGEEWTETDRSNSPPATNTSGTVRPQTPIAAQPGPWARGWISIAGFTTRNPWALVLTVLLQCSLAATVLRAMLRQRARERLLGRV
jgi:cellulose synthase (UDP-forming)